MKFLYAVQSEAELSEYKQFAESTRLRLDAYIKYLQCEYMVTELPKCILWTSGEIATKLIGDIPVPAYTNEHRIVMTPALDTWRSIYLKQLDAVDNVQDIEEYYRNHLTPNHVLQILGHELAHHSELFLDDFDESNDSIWFEEGMVEYISRRYFLTEEQFDAEARINAKLVEMLKNRYGNHSLEEFGKETYSGDIASIFFEYWRSFLAVNRIVNAHDGDVKAVFASYHMWSKSNSGKSLTEWFAHWLA